jgi:hypothetical protein
MGADLGSQPPVSLTDDLLRGFEFQNENRTLRQSLDTPMIVARPAP